MHHFLIIGLKIIRLIWICMPLLLMRTRYCTWHRKWQKRQETETERLFSPHWTAISDFIRGKTTVCFFSTSTRLFWFQTNANEKGLTLSAHVFKRSSWGDVSATKWKLVLLLPLFYICYNKFFLVTADRELITPIARLQFKSLLSAANGPIYQFNRWISNAAPNVASISGCCG